MPSANPLLLLPPRWMPYFHLGLLFLLVPSPMHAQPPQATLPFSEMTDAVREEVHRDLIRSPFVLKKAETYFLLTKAYLNRGMFGEAIREAEKGLTLDPYHPELRNLYAFALLKSGEPKRGIAQLQKVLTLDPANEYARSAMKSLSSQVISPPLNPENLVLFQKRDQYPPPPKATSTPGEEKPILSNPYYKDLESKRHCLDQMKVLELAVKKQTAEKKVASTTLDIKNLIDGGFLTIEPQCGDGGTYSLVEKKIFCDKHQGFDDLGIEVEKFYQDFVEAAKLKSKKDYPNSKKLFEKILSLHPNWGEIHYQLADIAFKEGEFKEALPLLRKAIGLDWGNPDYHFLEFLIFRELRHLELARKKGTFIIKKFPRSIYSLSCQKVLRTL